MSRAAEDIVDRCEVCASRGNQGRTSHGLTTGSALPVPLMPAEVASHAERGEQLGAGVSNEAQQVGQ
jgi:hypothetical protein